MNRRFLAGAGLVAMTGGATLWLTSHSLRDARREFERQAALAAQTAGSIARKADNEISFSHVRIAAGSTLGHTLAAVGVAPRLVANILESAGNVFDLRQIRAGNLLEIGRSPQGQLLAVRYQVDADRMLDVRATGDGFSADLQPVPSEIKEVNVSGQVRDSLFNAVADAGENPELAMRLADIFGWDLDFYTDTRRGDTFRVLVEKKPIPTVPVRAMDGFWPRNTTTAAICIRRCSSMTRLAPRRITPPMAGRCRKRFCARRSSLPRRSHPISAMHASIRF